MIELYLDVSIREYWPLYRSGFSEAKRKWSVLACLGKQLPPGGPGDPGYPTTYQRRVNLARGSLDVLALYV